jgi:hypothetical protein
VSAESKIEGCKVDAVFLMTVLSKSVMCSAILIDHDFVSLLVGEDTNFGILSLYNFLHPLATIRFPQHFVSKCPLSVLFLSWEVSPCATREVKLILKSRVVDGGQEH